MIATKKTKKVSYFGHQAERYELYNSLVGQKKDTSKLPDLVIGRTFTGLLLLTQSTKPEQGLTDTIVSITELLAPLWKEYARNNMVSRQSAKLTNMLNKDSWLHNRDYDLEEFRSRVVQADVNLSYVLDWYFESDEETPFDLTELARLASIIKTHAQKEFDKTCWATK